MKNFVTNSIALTSLFLILLTFPIITWPFPTSKCQTTIHARGKAKPGKFVFSAFDPVTLTGHFVVIDRDGHCLFEKAVPYAWDLRPHLINGKLKYSYLDSREGSKFISISGVRYILDENFNVVKKIQHTDESLSGPVDMDLHDFETYNEDNFTDIHYVSSFDWLGRCIVGNTLIEMNEGEKIFSWHTDQINIRFVPNFDNPNFRGFFCFDPFHLNSFQKTQTPAGYLISMKMPNSIEFVPKFSPAQSWTLGGPKDEFHIPEEARFRGQHTLRWDEGSRRLLIFDNGYIPLARDNLGKAARILQFDLDIESRKIVSWKEIYRASDYSNRYGSVEKCGENCFDVGFGISRSLPDLIEYDSLQKKITFEMSFGDHRNYHSIYRIYRIPEIRN